MNSRIKKYGRLISILLAAVLMIMLTTSAFASGKPLSAALDWRNVVPEGSGDPNGWGDAVLNINSGKSELCYEISTIFFHSASTTRDAAIHRGTAGVNGPVVINIGSVLPSGNTYTVTGCVSASSSLLKNIQQNPQGYYVQVVTDLHPNGALRGQLTNTR